MRFFHFAPMKLGPCSIIEPGNFGRVLTGTQIAIQGNPGSLIAGYVGRELMFELVRVREFPDKPSRLESLFGCPSLEEAQAYARDNNADNRQVLHEVEAIDPNASAHIAWLSHCDITIGALFMDATAQKAKLYWEGTQGDPNRGREVVIRSAIRVIRAV